MATEFVDEWRQANKNAIEAEQHVTRAFLGAISGTAALPTDEAIAEAKNLRSLADDLFQVAMTELKSQAARFNRYD